ncbi:MAG: metal ABC transporter permease [Coriobacteriales bacterium]|jgi:zinc transport system permease protein|nr:metal ABC transporter permease [Coriobacteriales bacterium]
MEGLSQSFSDPLFCRSLAAGALIAVCAGLIGINLVLRHYAMLSDGLTHVGIGAMSVAVFLHWAPIWFTMVVCVVAAILLLRLSERGVIRSDSGIALMTASALAIALVLTQFSGGSEDQFEDFLFGDMLSLSSLDLALAALLCLCVIATFLLCYRKFLSITFDATFARACGIKVGRYNTLLAVLAAVTVVLGMRLLGGLLMSAVIIFPALAGMQLIHNYKVLTIFTALYALACFVGGMLVSALLGLSCGACVVLVNLVCLLACFAIKHLRQV